MARFISDVVGLKAALEGKASAADLEKFEDQIDKKSDKGHGHVMGEVSGLNRALSGKSPIGHAHDASTITYSPADGSDWESSDPGNVNGALDELAERVQGIVESGAGEKLLATVPRGEAISGGRAVYLFETGGIVKAFPASAADAGKWAHGFVIEAGAADADVDVWEFCDIPGLSGINEGAPYFLGNSGEFVTAPPSGAAVIQRIGLGVTSTSISASIKAPTFVI